MALKRIILISALALILNGVSAQNMALIRDLQGQIKRASNATLPELLNNLAWEYRFAYPDSTIYYAEMSLELGKRLGLKTGLSKPLNFIGVAYDKKGEPVKAYDNFSAALNMALAQSDSVQIGHSYNSIGRLLSDQGLFSKGLNHYIKARTIFEALKDHSGLAYAFQSIGRTHEAQGDLVLAHEQYQKALALRKLLGNTRDIMAAYVLIGIVQQKADSIDKSLFYLHKADSAGKSIGDKINLAEIKVHLAKAYLTLGQLDTASQISKEGLSVIETQKAIRTLPDALVVYGRVLQAQGNTIEAKKYFLKALNITNQSKELDAKAEASYYLWQLEKLKGSSEELFYHRQYLLVRDSLKDLEATRGLERSRFEIEIQKRDMQSQLAATKRENDIRNARLQNIFLSIISLFTIAIAVILWRNNKKKQETNAQLVEQNHKLEELNHEKDTLMNIVAHDLKSPLNRINGLVQLAEKDPAMTPTYLGIIKKTSQSGLWLIGDLLDLNAANERSLSPEIVEFELKSMILAKMNDFKETASNKQIDLEMADSPTLLVWSDPVFIKRILDNLISNSLKFSHSKGQVTVRCGDQGQGFFIAVKDSGPGFSDKDKTLLFQKFRRLSAQPTSNESSNGLGLALIKALVDGLNGSIELISENRKGSEFIIQIPNGQKA